MIFKTESGKGLRAGLSRPCSMPSASLRCCVAASRTYIEWQTGGECQRHVALAVHYVGRMPNWCNGSATVVRRFNSDEGNPMPTKLHTPKYYCELSGLGLDHILRFIRSGELRASNVASSGAKRSRWLIAENDWEDFLASRATKESHRREVATPPTPQTSRRYV